MNERRLLLVNATTIALLTAFSYGLSIFIPAISRNLSAIFIGIFVANSWRGLKDQQKQNNSNMGLLLGLGVGLMGFKLELASLATIGSDGLLLIVVSVATAIAIAFFIGKLTVLERNKWLLLGIGNAICGSAAIAAASPILSASKEDTAVSIGCITLVGVIGMVLLPLIIMSLGLSPESSAILIGGSLQAMGQVMVAGYSLGEQVGDYSSIVKMARILMLFPSLVVLSLLIKSKSANYGTIIPWFVWLFASSTALTHSNILPTDVTTLMAKLSEIAITAALCSIGLSIKLSELVKNGSKMLAAALGMAVIHTAILIVMIQFL